MASCVNTHDFRVRICDAPETLIVRFALSSRYLSERQAIRLLKNRLYPSVNGVSTGHAIITKSSRV